MKKYGFVILHYIAYETTIASVDSLLNLFQKDAIEIVIVDNGSPNDSGELLCNHYKDNQNVHVIVNELNVGFAQGNNIGYSYLVSKFDVSYIIVMNNDVIISQKDFLKIIDEIYLENNFSVLGPDIISKRTGRHQNPYLMHEKSLEDIKTRIRKYERRVRFKYFSFILNTASRPIKKMKKFLAPSEKQKDYHMQEQMECVLHGSCLIFSKDFIKNREYCFNPRTFLYAEEDILKHECGSNNLLMMYSPKLWVSHYEDISANASMSSHYKRYIKKTEYMLSSLKILLDIMEVEKKN